jgi:flagellar basal body-associated protein FliL
MHLNQVYSENAVENNGAQKWWHNRRIRIIGISFIVVAIIAVVLSLVLTLAIPASKKPEATTTTTPGPLTISTPQRTTSTQQPGKFQSNTSLSPYMLTLK